MENFNLSELIENYQQGLFTFGELWNQIQYAAEITKETIKFPTVELICSSGIYFAIQNGECYKIVISANITKV